MLIGLLVQPGYPPTEAELRVGAPVSLMAQLAEPPSNQLLPEPSLTPLPPIDELLLPPPEESPSDPLPEAAGEIFVERFVIEGNTVIDDATLADVLEPFTQRSMSFAELLQARTAVTQYYLDAGYITSGAFIPPQTLVDGVVVIRVLEGQLTAINVEVEGRLDPTYVQRRLQRNISPIINQDNLLEALQLLQLDPLIETLSAELSTGVEAGTSILTVEVVQADTFDATLVVDNGQSPSVGSFRRGVAIREDNLLGFGDGLNLSYANSDGSNEVALSYRIPVNAAGGTFTSSLGFTDSEVIEAPFNVLDIQSGSRYYEFTYRQPVLQTPEREFALSLTASRQESTSEFLEEVLGEPIPFPVLGSDEAGQTRISVLRFAQEWTQREAYQVVAVRSQFSLGLGVLNATVNDEGPDGRFFAWRGQAQWVRLLDDDWLLLVRGDMQLAADSLVPLEQFNLGGAQTVRGYRQNALLTDSGFLLSSEIRIPVLRVEAVDGLLQVAPFVDIGHGWNLAAANPAPGTLASLGVGLLWQMGERFNARLDLGLPLIDAGPEGDSWQEDGVHFNLNLQLL